MAPCSFLVPVQEGRERREETLPVQPNIFRKKSTHIVFFVSIYFDHAKT